MLELEEGVSGCGFDVGWVWLLQFPPAPPAPAAAALAPPPAAVVCVEKRI